MYILIFIVLGYQLFVNYMFSQFDCLLCSFLAGFVVIILAVANHSHYLSMQNLFHQFSSIPI